MDVTATPFSPACTAFLELARAGCKARGAQLTPIRRDVLGLLHDARSFRPDVHAAGERDDDRLALAEIDTSFVAVGKSREQQPRVRPTRYAVGDVNIPAVGGGSARQSDPGGVVVSGAQLRSPWTSRAAVSTAAATSSSGG